MKYLFPILASATLLAACNNSSTTTTASKTTDSATARTDSFGAGGKLELVYQDSMHQFTGISVSPQGEVYVSYPRWAGPYRFAIVKVKDAMNATPFPDTAMNSWDETQPGLSKWVCVQNTYFDDAGTMWVLDPAAPQLQSIKGKGAKLVKMDAAGKPARVYGLSSFLQDTSYANDVQVDTKLSYAYLTDSKIGAIIVLNLATGKGREVLRGQPSTLSDPAYHFVIDGHEMMKNGKPAKFNSDGIALTPDGQYLYYKSVTDDKLYRIKTEALRDESLSEAALGGKVEDLGHFCSTDGMVFDKDGNLYLGDAPNYRMVRIDKNLKMTTLIKDNRLIWPDTYFIRDGYLYITCSQIHKQPEYNEGNNKRTTPYAVYRMKL